MKKSVMVATPMYGGVAHMGYISGLMYTALDLSRHDIEFKWEFIGNESLITRGRNHLANKFMKSDCTHLIFIDADISFPHNAIRKLLDTNLDFVCAPYPKKFIDWEKVEQLCSRVIKPKEFNAQYCSASYVVNFLDPVNPPQVDENFLVEIRHGGTGFMMVSRKVFETLEPLCSKVRDSDFYPNNFTYTEYFKIGIDEDGRSASEDWLFCDMWRQTGGKLYLKTDINLHHTGLYTYSGDINFYGPNIK